MLIRQQTKIIEAGIGTGSSIIIETFGLGMNNKEYLIVHLGSLPLHAPIIDLGICSLYTYNNLLKPIIAKFSF